jgi:hypothetical protein
VADKRGEELIELKEEVLHNEKCVQNDEAKEP